MAQSETLVNVLRGDIVESYHTGDVAVVDKRGKLLFYTGDPRKTTYMRSAAKPLQALAYVERGGHSEFSFGEDEIAVTCASHSGEAVHTEAVLSILKKIGLDESFLQCGTHEPLHKPTAERLRSEGRAHTSVHSNCSGKHAGMLTLARILSADTKDYLEVGSPVQTVILQTASEMLGISPEKVKIGIDGCGAPVFGVSLSNMAFAFAKLSEPEGLSANRALGVDTISRAMRHNPVMVAGTGRFNTRLMEVAGDRLVAKSGAEGVFCVGLIGRGMGISIKVADGNGNRGLTPALIQILKELDVLKTSDTDALMEFYRPELKNFKGEHCGEIKPCVTLRKA